MIKAIIFANRQRGYDLYEESLGFPQKYKADIHSLCNRAGTKIDSEASLALRYAPLNDRFLLQVIFRFPRGNEDQSRAHHAVVSFLMDTHGADAFFRLPFAAAAENAKQLAQKLLQQSRNAEALAEDLTGYLLTPAAACKIPPVSRDALHALWYGARQSSENPIRTQLFFASDSPCEPILMQLLETMPQKLRKYLRFSTNINTGGDAAGVTLSFGSVEAVRTLKDEDFLSCPDRTDKYCFCTESGKTDLPPSSLRRMGQILHTFETCPEQKLLPQIIENWDDLNALAQAAESGAAALTHAVLDLISPDILLQAYKSGLLTASDIARYHKLAPKNAAVLAVYRLLPQHNASAAGSRKKTRRKKAAGKLPKAVGRIGFFAVLIALLSGIAAALMHAVRFVPLASDGGSVVLELQHMNSFLNDLLLVVLSIALGSILTLFFLRGKNKK